MLAIYLAPVYILLNLYVLRWSYLWIGNCHHLFQSTVFRVILAIVYVLISTTPLTGFLIKKPASLHRILKVTSNYFLGIFMYILMIVLSADIIRLILKYVFHASWIHSRVAFAIAGAICIFSVLLISIRGIYHAKHINVTPYEVTVDKSAGELDSLKIVLIADTHFGYNAGTIHAKEIVKKINRQNPDLVCIAGDIFDNEWEAVQEPARMAELLRGIRSKYGVYACYGNHDIEEPILAGFTFRQRAPKASSPQMDAFLSDAGIQLLRDEGVLLNDSFYLYGRADAQRPGAGISERKSPQEITADMDKTRPIIVIDHQPRELAALAAAGVDIDLCGHTHDGQMFPGNLVVRPFWENFYGYLQKGSMHNIVTSGVGLFGPNMRVGTKAEICPITVHFSGSVNAQETTD